MALAHMQFAIDVEDAIGVRKSFPIYAVYEDTTATLSTLTTYAQATATLLDAITEAKLVGITMKFPTALPGGLKASAVANSDVEETGLFTWDLLSTPLRAYGEDIPAFLQSAFVGKNINQAETHVAAWIAHQTNLALAAYPTDRNYVSHYGTLRSAQKTFRKSRRALKRA